MPCLEITTMVGCPLRCTFCPQDKLIHSYRRNEKYLSLENFKLVLAKIPPYVRIDFSGMSEPWANPAATEMLAHTLERGFNVTIYTTLQGMDDHERVVGLLLAHRDQVEAIVIHLTDELGNMRGFKSSQAYTDALKWFTNASACFRSFQTMSMGEGWSGLTRAGNLDPAVGPVETSPRHSTPLACSFTPFYDHNVLLPNGDVVLCCMDYSVKHKLGNLIEDEYFSLFRSDGLNALRVENMRYGNGESLCRKCSRARPLDLTESKQFWEAAVT